MVSRLIVKSGEKFRLDPDYIPTPLSLIDMYFHPAAMLVTSQGA